MEYQQIVHGQPAYPPVAVHKRVDVLKFGMEIRRRCQRVFRGYIQQFFQQLPYRLPHPPGGPGLLAARHVVMTLILEIESLARCLFPKIQAYFASPEGQAAFEEWKRQQEHT